MTEDDSTQDIAEFIDAFQTLHHKTADGQRDLNLFSLFNIGADEVSHSAFLAWLFDPQGSHSQGASLLQAFLDVAEPPIELSLPEIYQVQTELARMRSIIDIVIFKAQSFILYIENKTTSPDTPGQHDREVDDLRRLGEIIQVPPDRQFPIYLTPHGRKARGESKAEWYRVSYRDLGLAFSRMQEEISDVRTGMVVKDWLETIQSFSGMWRNAVTELSESSVLLGANWRTVLEIERARERLDEELIALLFSIEGTLAQQTWWQRGWMFRKRPGKEMWIINNQWRDSNEDTPLWMGVYWFSGSHVFGPQAPPTFYFRVRGSYEKLTDMLREQLRAEGQEVLDDHRHLLQRPILQCPPDRAAIKSYPDQVREQIVDLFTEYVDFALRHEDMILDSMACEA